LQRLLRTPLTDQVTARVAAASAPATPASRNASAETDSMLVLALREHDLSAAARLYDRYATNVRGMVRRLLGPDMELDDVVQDVFVAAITSIGRLRDPAALKGWLLGIAVGKVRDNLRARWRRRWLSFLPHDELPEHPAPSADSDVDVSREVCSILDHLPPEERIALLLHRLEGLSLEEAARACDMSVSTFKRRLARGETKFSLRARRRPALAEWLGTAGKTPPPAPPKTVSTDK
jgi:RNA polymerase sigma-70 factor, ECF subfamily